ncbi:hypothetical protein MYAER_1606 [Microcystis aeruginosa NIES-2549]|uniref:Uncharacterized protein n=3 Tax=Microcystis aeruginosa TaxID=1126 RepID=A0A0F6RL02_MICAE|nr:hypothetical protein MYAER_1606 [Microcystis aeruginosa NIES-2549]AOC52345.1 hypothetical protein amyaer_1620 [Microcystis aeruginosa NIES-2481]ARI79874.1 hypothetical protein BH695_0593 [Microcystis aeruginosa PCC 7806SL]ELP53666.1 hypothetical protein O53_2472 [Microcystis aeruginosa TAIHU98]ELS45085.1 hypothetical protein C789_5125 [Microcystis aeruginosa FACHB-905 = DIANCHI905]
MKKAHDRRVTVAKNTKFCPSHNKVGIKRIRSKQEFSPQYL